MNNLMPLTAVTDETGFSAEINGRSSPFSIFGVFEGQFESRVYADQLPGATSVAFIYDLTVSGLIGEPVD